MEVPAPRPQAARVQRGWLRADPRIVVLLALLPVIAHAPAWWEGRLLGPGDGAALHLPLKTWVWEAYREGRLPAWNPHAFSGTPLLAAYRGGALYPPVIALSWLDPFSAFQVLVLFSLSATAVLTFLYLRRLRAHPLGAYVAGMCFALGPYLVGHIDDSATLSAAPLLPLLLLAAESHMKRESLGRAAGLAGAVALSLLAGSPEAARAAVALVAGRLLLGHLSGGARGPRPRTTLLALLAGVLLAAPQLVPTLIALREAGRQATGFATGAGDDPAGAAGLILRYVSHTPAASLALAALPLALSEAPVRVLGLALALALGLQWGRGPLSSPGALSLVFDFALAVLAGLSLSAQWRARHAPEGRRLRAWLLVSCLASCAALSLAAAALGALPQALAGAVGVMAVGLILYFANCSHPDPIVAGAFVLPLTAAFVLQPHAREGWRGAPTREEWRRGTVTSRAIDQALGSRRGERLITLAREWPAGSEADLAYGGRGAANGRRAADGYDPMVSLRYRRALDGMGPAGALPGAFFRSDPARLELLGVRWIQAPASALSIRREMRLGLGERLDLALEAGQPRLLPLPFSLATEVRVASLLSDAVELPDEAPVARVVARLPSGREVSALMRAGRETAEWAYDRPDVRPRVAHARAPVFDSWSEGGFLGHVYLGTLPLPGRYWIDGLRLERLPGPGRLLVARIAVVDGTTGTTVPVSLVSGFLSDPRLREAAVTPQVRLFELPGIAGRAWVVERVRRLEGDGDVLSALHALGTQTLDPRREALMTQREAQDLEWPQASAASRAEIVREEPGRIEVRAMGPGLLVVAEGWDPGWSARLDGRDARVFRVNHVQMGLPLQAGAHRVVLSYRPRGFGAGVALAALGAALLGSLALSPRRD